MYKIKGKIVAGISKTEASKNKLFYQCDDKLNDNMFISANLLMKLNYNKEDVLMISIKY